ncbi:MAG: 16S rRNA (uracil(1498)-N(3))-methyltransferase [Verrucomicrobia bacterium]|nr:16S rRNA (uracil(1498)-N(3))-methyltransferase [Verrucomicrobiota bacterium]
MHRFYLPPEQTQQSSLTLSDGDAHHALHVLRLKRSDRVAVLDGVGSEFLCEIKEADARRVTLEVVSKLFIPPLPYRLTLVQAVPKGKTMDLIVQKATELGADRVVPILSERTVAQVNEEAASGKAQKWRATAIEAIKQCGSAWLTKIDSPISPAAFLSREEKPELSLMATLQKNARHPRSCFQSFLAEHGRLPNTISVWVGPEGDFTPAEVNAIAGSGAWPITLGQLILRCETAAIYCLAALNYELQAPLNGAKTV